MKVLVFTPMNPSWPHLYGRTVESIYSLKWDEPLDYLSMRGDIDVENQFERVTWKYQQGRKAFLRGDYDAMLTVEADMVIPPDTLERLVATDADVAYGLYVLRRGMPRWCAFTEVKLGEGKSLSEDPDLARQSWNKVIPVQGVGMGCTLIRRHVLEEIDFRREPYEEAPCNDWYFSIDCQEKGYIQKCDLGVICGHIAAKPSPRILWPDPEAKRLYSIEFLGGEWVPVKPGETVEVIIDRIGVEPVTVFLDRGEEDDGRKRI